MDNFEKAGYGQREIGFGERPALIMVDFQLDLMEVLINKLKILE